MEIKKEALIEADAIREAHEEIRALADFLIRVDHAVGAKSSAQLVKLSMNLRALIGNDESQFSYPKTGMTEVVH